VSREKYIGKAGSYKKLGYVFRPKRAEQRPLETIGELSDRASELTQGKTEEKVQNG